ncbi:hypothetical protein GCM10007932_22830 [Vibrio penaeicida]|uniref:PepSY domain-containing protein n=1 Tax=Vibrio penaeicida TaxID=104609 RepID=A0AAV5NRP3_9VIBR|nr:hypothetical protein GCM10007932_22830 [Vibrio penaeicida]
MLLDGLSGSKSLIWSEVNRLSSEQSDMWLHFDYSKIGSGIESGIVFWLVVGICVGCTGLLGVYFYLKKWTILTERFTILYRVS